MMTVTVKHSDGRVSIYNNIVSINLIDKSLCEQAAGRELSDKELKYISNAIDGCEYFPIFSDLEQIVEEMNREVNNA